MTTIYLAVAVLMLAIGSLVIAVLAGRRNLPKTDAETDGETGAGRTARFLDRLPPELGRDLVCLKMADHYVEVFTTSGSTLILIRFADVVAELEDAGGLRVHRSYWVVRDHVTGVTRRNGRRHSFLPAATRRRSAGATSPMSARPVWRDCCRLAVGRVEYEEIRYPIVRVLVSKYVGHFPLYRQSRIYTHSAFKLHRSMLATLMNTTAADVTPAVDG